MAGSIRERGAPQTMGEQELELRIIALNAAATAISGSSLLSNGYTFKGLIWMAEKYLKTGEVQ